MDKRRFAARVVSSQLSRMVPAPATVPVVSPAALHRPLHGGYCQQQQLPQPGIASEVQQPDATRLPIDSSLRNPFSLGEW